MNELEKRKQRDSFNKWRKRAIKRITPLLVKFFSNEQTSENSRMVGRIVERLHDPYYDIMVYGRERLDEQSVIACRIFLQLEVEQFCELMNK